MHLIRSDIVKILPSSYVIDLFPNLPFNLSIKSLLAEECAERRVMMYALVCSPFLIRIKIQQIMALPFQHFPSLEQQKGISKYSLFCIIHDILTDLEKESLVFVLFMRLNSALPIFMRMLHIFAGTETQVGKHRVGRCFERIICGYIMIRLYELKANEREEKKRQRKIPLMS